MSNNSKGALVVSALAIALTLFALISPEWRLRFSYNKDSDGSQWEQSERYGLRGVQFFYGCKKGCLGEKKSKTKKELRTWSKLSKLMKRGLERRRRRFGDEGTLGVLHKRVERAAIVSKIMYVVGGLSVLIALFSMVALFLRRLAKNKKLPFALCGFAGSLQIIMAFYTSGTLRSLSGALYEHATYNPHEVESRASLALFAAVGGGVLLVVSGLLRILDKGSFLERFQLESQADGAQHEEPDDPQGSSKGTQSP